MYFYEDEQLYHTQGWARELWIVSLGMEGRAATTGREKTHEERDWRITRTTGAAGDALIQRSWPDDSPSRTRLGFFF